jgi:uncharacterized protein with PQ loop repeat
MNGPNLIGLAGAIIAGYAYLPQITHLIKEQCSAGVSQSAFLLWLISSILVTINALYIRAWVFVVLGTVQIVSTALVFLYSTKYRDQVCGYHAHQYDK